MFIAFFILAALSFVILAVIVARHFSDLRILNVDTTPGARMKKIKASILAERLGRLGRDRVQKLRHGLAPFRAIGSQFKKRFEERLGALELAYLDAKRKTMRTRGKRTAQIVGLLREAEDAEQVERFEDAERKYIAVASLDPKNVDAYEGLGNLYARTKRYKEARESLEFILKFRPNDASVLTSLGEIALVEEKFSDAFDSFKRAIDLRPGNPKYLDFFINAALRAKNKREAERGLEMMKKVNAENAKIGEWEEKIRML